MVYVRPGASPSADVQMVMGVAKESHQIRRVVLTGPLIVPGTTSSFTIIISNYGEKVDVTPPAGVQ